MSTTRKKIREQIQLKYNQYVDKNGFNDEIDVRVIDIDLATPIPVYPSEFVQLVAKNIGTVTTTGAITFLVSFGGYWE